MQTRGHPGLPRSGRRHEREHDGKALARDPEVKAVIMADASVTYGRVIAVVDRIRSGGIAKLAFAMPMPAPSP